MIKSEIVLKIFRKCFSDGYGKWFLERLVYWVILKFYNDRDNWIRTMRSCIAINASFFNTNRMVQLYVLNAYFR